jgi:type VI secretion system protein ImpA
MMIPTQIDLEGLLGPLAGSSPSGRELVWEPEYDAIREARRFEDESLEQGAWRRKPKAAEWPKVVELAEDCLRQKSKDLRIAAWMAEALTRLHGLAGLRDGLLLLQGLLERFWDTLHPTLDDGDPEARAGALAYLSGPGQLPLAIRAAPLTDGGAEERYSSLHWVAARAPANSARGAEGTGRDDVTLDQLEAAVARSSRRFYEGLGDDLGRALDAFEALDETVRRRLGLDAPSLADIRRALDDCRGILVPILEAKRRQEPDLGPGPAAPAAAEDWPAEVPRDRPPDAARAMAPAPADSPAMPPDPPPIPRRDDPIADVGDAHRRILDAAAYLRRNDPGNPVPFAVVRALRLAEVCIRPRPHDPGDRPAPTGEVRRALRRLAAEGSWDELREEAERTLARPEGRDWLDAHRLAIVALEAGTPDVDLSACATAARILLRALLSEVPDLPGAELDDGTPAASPETRAWLEAEGLVGARHEEPSPALPAVDPCPADAPARSDGTEPDQADAWDRAARAVDEGRVREGIALLHDAASAARSGRETFALRLRVAELCLRAGHPRAALPLLEDLTRQVDAFHLEQWEDASFSVRAWDALYRCLRAGGAGSAADAADRLDRAYARLCRLDVGRALACGDGGAAQAGG